MWQECYDNLITQRQKERDKNKYSNLFMVSLSVFIVILLFLRTFVFCSVVVDGTSMENTLFDGNVLLVNKLDTPNRGDIVIFYRASIDENGNITYQYNSNGDKIMYIKRIIGLPNDSVYWVGGDVYIKYTVDGVTHNEKLDEPYAKNATYSGLKGNRLEEDAVFVPEGHFFVLGDNRLVSADSRIIGTVDSRLIVGVVQEFSIQRKDSRIWNMIFKLL